MVPERRFGGISLGGILVIVGLVVAPFFSLILGLAIAVVGLVAFGGFVRGSGISGPPRAPWRPAGAA